MGKLDLLDFETEIGAEIFWQGEARSLSFHAIKKLALAQTHFEGIEPGSICAICGFSALETWIMMLAAWRQGLGILPFSEKATPASIELALGQLPWSLRLQRSPGSWESRIPAQKSFNPQGKPQAGADVFIMTSGSTGSPKAIAHGLEGLAASARATLDFYDWKQRDSWLLSLDPSHIGGLQILLRVWLGRGLLYYGGEPKEVDVALKARSCDYLSLVPTQLFRLLESPATEAPLRRAKAILLGGAQVQASLLEQLRQLDLPVSITYGSSETASQISAFKPSVLPDRKENVGEVLKIWTMENTPQKDLWISGPALMLGYWQERRWHGIENGRFELSDRGALEGDSLILAGRRDQVFQVGGENLAPGEILSLIETLHPQTDLQLLTRADEVFGLVPRIVVRSRKRPEVEALLKAFVALPPIKRPREIWWFESDEVAKLSKAHLEHLLALGDDHMQRLWTYEKI